MPDLPHRIGQLLGVPVRQFRLAGTSHGYQHVTGILADGRSFFAKTAAGPGAASPAADAFAAEANGLRWLAAADGGPPVPAVLGVSADFLVIELVGRPGPASPRTARQFGAALARLHAAGADRFGAPWPGFIASLPLDNSDAGDAGWPAWYATRRLRPYLRRAVDAGTIPDTCVRLVETVITQVSELAGPPEAPSRLHGDLWSGNVLWADGSGWLIDPAAHGGHRETDLAMLALFGAPHLDEIRAAYTETVPLADGWPSRVPLHQLHPLLVHVCLFGQSYAAQLAETARAALAG
jgi:fructosamine-3-kinase